MQRFKITIEYDGTNYCGWQMQDNGISIQQTMQEIMQSFFNQQIKLYASGRTDSGVHAVGQVAHFDCETKMTPYSIKKAINILLPKDIKIVQCERATDTFNARYDAKIKTYCYWIYNAEENSPLRENRAYFCKTPLDVEAMKIATKYFLGEHDFVGFRSAHSCAESTVRQIYSFDIEQKGCDVFLTITGNGFLYNMVRIIAGTLLQVGLGKTKAEEIGAIIASHERKCAGKTLSACGLYLKRVEY
ncbi:MAG: tRNA pseudouridine(38-40) synthase TruA [Clostridia bacterium]